MKTLIEKTSDKLVNAFLKNKIIASIPRKFSKKLSQAQKFRKLCESKIDEPVVGFKAAGTGIPVLKKLKVRDCAVSKTYGHFKICTTNKHSIPTNRFSLTMDRIYYM